ncbi:MAG: excinuclease ABC subunit UvrC [Hydrotalea sp.]|nr:excinuclease ABC subunit UvrC [Hydrotalea sp.]
MTSLKNGVAVILNYCNELPRGEENLPAVYRMINKDNDVIYVGKAKQLKKRLVSYTKPQKLGNRIQRMIAETAKMEFIITHTEAEALLLESNLIKELQPRYNILLRDDKSFPMVLIRRDHPFPQILKHRGAKKTKGDYFGPYASTRAVNESLVVLERVFQLRNCSDSIFSNRKRPCLQFHIKRCTAPCVGKISEVAYEKNVASAKQFLQGGSRHVQTMLEKDMAIAAAKRDYEKAAEVRDRIQALTKLQQSQTINIGNLSADIVALYRGGNDKQVAIQLFFYRDGQNHGNRAFFPKISSGGDMGDNGDDDIKEIMASFLAQFYRDMPPPPEILLSHPCDDQATLELALTQIHGKKVTISVPQKGIKKSAMDEAVKNAKWSLMRKTADEAQTSKNLTALFALAEQHNQMPGDKLSRIEIYDNSHLQGSNPVGAMVVYGRDGFDKKSYRLFNFDARRGGGDDIAFMTEMLTRRLSRAINEGPPLPDLIMLDGGKPQLSAAIAVLADLGLSTQVPLMAIAKGVDRNAGRERLFFPPPAPSAAVPEVALALDDPLQFFIQRLRDEAHRFAIMAHRKKRKKDIERTTLDDIPGIGAKRKRALINHFGSAQLVQSAGIADLMKVQGISKDLAEHIYHFHH